MKVSERFTSENLFEELHNLHPFPFVEHFPVDKVNLFYLNTYGDRTLSKMGRNLTVSEIASVIVGLHSEKWDKIYSSMMLEYPVLENHVETFTETIKENGKTTNDTSETSLEKVSAYNDNDFVNDEQTTNTNSMSGTNENEVVKTTEKKVTENATKNIENAIKYLQNNVIYNIIFSDINNVLTLNIFE